MNLPAVAITENIAPSEFPPNYADDSVLLLDEPTASLDAERKANSSTPSNVCVRKGRPLLRRWIADGCYKLQIRRFKSAKSICFLLTFEKVN